MHGNDCRSLFTHMCPCSEVARSGLEFWPCSVLRFWAAGRRETCTSWAHGDSSPVEGKSCAGLRSASFRWTAKRDEKDKKKRSNSDKPNEQKKDVFSSYCIVGLNFQLKNTCVRLNFHLLEHFATRNLRCTAFSYGFNFRLLYLVSGREN